MDSIFLIQSFKSGLDITKNRNNSRQEQLVFYLLGHEACCKTVVTPNLAISSLMTHKIVQLTLRLLVGEP